MVSNSILALGVFIGCPLAFFGIILLALFVNWVIYRSYRIEYLTDRDLIWNPRMVSQQLMVWYWGEGPRASIGVVEVKDDALTLKICGVLWSSEKIPPIVIPRKDIIGVLEVKFYLERVAEIYYDKEGETCCVKIRTNSNTLSTLSLNFISMPISRYNKTGRSGFFGYSIFANINGISKDYFPEQPCKLIENQQPKISEPVTTVFVDARYLRKGVLKNKDLGDDDLKKLPFALTFTPFSFGATKDTGIEIYDEAIKIKSVNFSFIIPKSNIATIRKLPRGFSIIHSAKNAPERVDVYHGKIDVIEAAFRNFGYPIQ